MSSFQPNNLQGAAATGYSIVNPAATPANTAVLVCRTGEFWVRPFTVAANVKATSGVNATLSSPAGSGVVANWLHMLPGDKQYFGDTLSDPIQQMDIWCVVAGEMLISQH
jgi:hypothetical protein